MRKENAFFDGWFWRKELGKSSSALPPFLSGAQILLLTGAWLRFPQPCLGKPLPAWVSLWIQHREAHLLTGIRHILQHHLFFFIMKVIFWPLSSLFLCLILNSEFRQKRELPIGPPPKTLTITIPVAQINLRKGHSSFLKKFQCQQICDKQTETLLRYMNVIPLSSD